MFKSGKIKLFIKRHTKTAAKHPRWLNLVFFFIAFLIAFLAVNIFDGRISVWNFVKRSSYREARLILTASDDATRTFEGEVREGMTVLEAILASAKGGNFIVDYDIRNGRTEFHSLNGLSKETPEDWEFYLNQSPVTKTEAHRIPIKKGDLIEIRAK